MTLALFGPQLPHLHGNRFRPGKFQSLSVLIKKVLTGTHSLERTKDVEAEEKQKRKQHVLIQPMG